MRQQVNNADFILCLSIKFKSFQMLCPFTINPYVTCVPDLGSLGRGLVHLIWHSKQFFEDEIITVGLIFMYKLRPTS